MEYLVRFTPNEEVELSPKELGLYVLKNKKTIVEILVCRELGTLMEGLHYHMYIRDAIANEEWSNSVREKIKRDLKKFLMGQVHINKDKIRDKIRAIAYNIKDDDVWSHNISWIDFIRAKEASFKKVKPYKIQIKEWYDNASNKGEKTLTKELITIFKTFRIPIDIDKIAKMVRCALIVNKDDSDYEKRLVDLVLDRL